MTPDELLAQLGAKQNNQPADNGVSPDAMLAQLGATPANNTPTNEQLQTTNQLTTGGEPIGPNAPTLGDFVDTAGKSVAGVAGGIGKGIFDIGAAVTSGLGNFDNPVSKFLNEQSQKVATAAHDLGIPDSSVKVGEVATAAAPIGGVIGGTLALVGKTSVLAGKTGKIARAIRTTIDEAAKSPTKAVLTEAAITSGGAGAGEATRQTTGSEGLGLLAEFGTGSILGTKAAKLAYGLSTAKEDAVSSVLAERLRQNPELRAVAEQNAAAMADEGLKIRFDAITKDPSVVATMRDLEKHGLQDTRDQIDSIAASQSDALHATASVLDNHTITPGEAGNIIDSIRADTQAQLDDTIASLSAVSDASTREAIGNQMFDTLAKIKDAGEKEAIRLYGLNAGDTVLPEEARGIIEAAIRKAGKTFAADKGFVLKQVEPALDAVKAELGRESGVLSASGINEVRGALLGMARTLVKSPDGRNAARRLFDLNDGLSKALDLAPSENLKAANKLWRTIRSTFDRSDIAFFFKENADGLINAPETFVSKFLTGARSSKATQDLIDFANTDIAKQNGLNMDAIRNFARQGFLADLRASVSDVSSLTPQKVGVYVAKHRDMMDKFGLTDEFKSFGKVAKKARELKLSANQIDRLTLNKFSVSDNPQTLRNALNTGAYKQQMARLPEEIRPAFKRTLLNAAIRGSDGKLLSPNDIANILSSHKDLAESDAHLARISRIANLIATPDGSKAFEQFSRFFANIDLGEKIKSAATERVARLLMKIARVGTSTQAFFRNAKAQDRMVDYMFTDAGSKAILRLASKDRQSKAFIRALAAARTASTQDGGQ